jgi:hypothetical protein
MENRAMQMIKETDQYLTEELFEELQLHGWKVVEVEPSIDSDRRTLVIKDDQNREVVLRVLPDGSLEGHKTAIKKALLEQCPYILDSLA